MLSKKYQPEIDGLRAIAVVGVLLFHFGLPWVPGGYIGVDVFFVISGFLITRLIYNELQLTGEFSFSNFYVRRARRLFPALFFTLAISLFFGVILLSPSSLERLGASAIHALMSISNFFFWFETGYFDLEATKKPLLHTWSLSVEEQFYIVWPVTILLVFRIAKSNNYIALAIVSCIGIVSIIASEYWLDEAPSAVFYLMPYRVYEFVIGAVLIWIPSKLRNNDIRLEILLLIGLALIVYSMVTLDSASRFPGANVLPAVIGTALTIYSCEAKIVGRLLRNKLSVFIGLISYSLYLAHWPIIVFYEHIFNTKTVASSAIFLGALTIVLAIFMYRYIETPFRKGTIMSVNLSRSGVGFCVVTFSISLIYPAFLLVDSNGWPARLVNRLPSNIEIQEVPSYPTWTTIRMLSKNKIVDDGRKNIHIIGDSQAADLVNILTIALNEDEFQMTAEIVNVFCGALFIHEERHDDYFDTNRRIQAVKNSRHHKKSCVKRWKELQTSKNIVKADYILLSNLWYDYQLEYLPETIRFLRSITNAKIILVGNKVLTLDSQEIATRCVFVSRVYPVNCFETIEQLNQYAAVLQKTKGQIGSKSYFTINKIMKGIAEDSDIDMLDMYEMLCGLELDSCTIYSEEGVATFIDTAHFNDIGMRIMADRLKKSGFLGSGG